MIFQEPKFKEWLENSTFDNCKLNRREFGHFLADYLTGEHDGFVLNLNGSWGAGKTEFLKRLYSLFITRNYPCIYIDAWESDFSKDPLTVISSELLTQMQLLHGDVVNLDDVKTTKKYLGRMLKGLAVGTSGYITKKILDDSSLGIAAAQQVFGIETTPEEYVDQLSSDYSQQVDSIKHIKSSLSDLAKSMETSLKVNLPVIVLVDELDRCRPNYAIEMLEVIKHFFNTPKFVFVVASDTEQLCESIKNVYGAKFDSHTYLKRFFDRRTVLPKTSLLEYVQQVTDEKFESEVNHEGIVLYPDCRDHNPKMDTLERYLARISESFDLRIRDIDQLLARLRACLRHSISQYNLNGKVQVINLPILIMSLIDFDLESSLYSKRSNKGSSGLIDIPNNGVMIDDDLSVDTLLGFCLASVVLHQVMSNNNSVVRYRRVTYRNYESYVGGQHTPYIKRFVVNSITNTVANYTNEQNKNKANVWLWTDYKKIIELAGNIE